METLDQQYIERTARTLKNVRLQAGLSLREVARRAGTSHAFGGALALAWCTERARGTIDIDVNVFAGKISVAARYPFSPAWILPSSRRSSIV